MHAYRYVNYHVMYSTHTHTSWRINTIQTWSSQPGQLDWKSLSAVLLLHHMEYCPLKYKIKPSAPTQKKLKHLYNYNYSPFVWNSHNHYRLLCCWSDNLLFKYFYTVIVIQIRSWFSSVTVSVSVMDRSWFSNTNTVNGADFGHVRQWGRS